MKKLFIIPLTFWSFSLLAQSSEEKQVLQVVERVFEAMRASDSTMLKTCFTADAATYTLFTDQEGKPQIKKGSLERFIDAVGQPKEDVWNEPIWNEKVQIDGPLAAVWVDYAFYLNNQFLHCGVDAFQLVKTEEGWKIFHLADTRRKENCVVPEEVKRRME
ncbi:nuclear transport factor 2 family protein [Reichenbachiella sp.]|uniref:nuclear transport factor 2 family protein n=1 Tax=Reichenbachiella sp. TaxID=2184521 RepID=UPI003B59728D